MSPELCVRLLSGCLNVVCYAPALIRLHDELSAAHFRENEAMRQVPGCAASLAVLCACCHVWFGVCALVRG